MTMQNMSPTPQWIQATTPPTKQNRTMDPARVFGLSTTATIKRLTSLESAMTKPVIINMHSCMAKVRRSQKLPA